MSDEEAEIVDITEARAKRLEYERRRTERHKRKLLRDQAGKTQSEGLWKDDDKSVPWSGGIDDLKIEE